MKLYKVVRRLVLNRRMKAFLSKEHLVVLVIFVLAFSIRLIYLQEIKTNPFFENPITDNLWHDTWAQEIARGNWVGEEVFFRAPLYPYFLGSIYRVFGHDYYTPRLIQTILGSLSCVLIFFIAKLVFNRTTAIIAALIACFYGVFVYFDGELLITSLVVFLDLLLILTLLKTSEKWRSFSWVFSGIVFGLSAIARPAILVFLVGVFIWMAIQKKGKILVQGYLLLCFGIGVIVLPVTLRNYLVGKDFVLISSQGGINFWIGNNPRSDGKTAHAPSMDKPPMGVKDNIWYSSVKVAERTTGREMKASEVSDFWFKEGFQFLKNEPLNFIALQLKKLYFFWNGFELESNKNIYLYRRFSFLFRTFAWVWGIAFPFGLVCAFGVVGMYLCRKKWRRLVLLYLFISIYMIAVVAFFVTARFRTPIVPLLIIFMAYAIYWFYKGIKEGNYQRMIVPAVLLTCIVFVSNSNFFDVRKTNVLREHWLLGYAYARSGSYKEAVSELKKAVKYDYDPFILAQVHYILGDIYCVQKKYENAEKEYIAAIKINPSHAKVYFQLGNLYMMLGYLDEAENAYRNALKISPDFKEAKVNLTILLQKKRLLKRN